MLRSPWVTGALVVVAVVVVFYQLVPLHGASAVRVAAPPAVPAAHAPSANTSALPENPSAKPASLPKPADLPSQAVDCVQLHSRFVQWLEAPGRDPFWLLPTRSEASVHRYPSPVLVWKLKAIWRQTNGRVAAIDKRICAEGDTIDGYRIQKIEADRVVFEGPDGSEVLTFSPAGASQAAKKK